MRRLAWVFLLLLPTTGWAATTGYNGRLRAAILAACPAITSITLMVNGDRGVGLSASDTRPAGVDFDVTPTMQGACVQTTIAAFDWTQTTQDAWDLVHLRSDAATQIQSETSSDAKLKRALAAVLLDELNLHALKHNAILDAVDAATSLADLKTRIAAIPDYPQRTLTQLITAIQNKINAGTVD
jgi:hypothetical protein